MTFARSTSSSSETSLILLGLISSLLELILTSFFKGSQTRFLFFKNVIFQGESFSLNFSVAISSDK